jgi:molecular chaperone DnaJ
VSARFSGLPRTVEITLPPDFVVGRPIRLKGLGRKLGPFTGDLYLRILAK